MKRILPLIVFGMLLACSKPAGDDTSSADTLATPSLDNGNAPISLTDEEIVRVNLEIFLKFHNDLLYDGDPEVMAYQEEFTTDGNEFHYRLLRHNGSKAGLHEEGWDIPAPEPEPYSEQAEGSEEGDESEDSEEYSEGDGEEYVPQMIYISEIDTIYIDGRYVVFPAGDPESKLKTVKCVFAGKQRFVNANYVSYGEPVYQAEQSAISDLTIELGAPRQLHRDHLYLKAKIAVLTDQDLAGLNKDELGFVRNEIFARHGHTFKTDKMIKHFAQKSWYHSLADDAVELLNQFERQNVEFIKKKEG